MRTLTELRDLLAAYGAAPQKRFGQNFLIDQNLLAKLVDASAPRPGELALEIGPGAGALTRALLERGVRVVAVEIDRALARLLRETLGAEFGAQLTLIEADAMAGPRALNPAICDALRDEPYRLIANLPYNVATPIMMILLLDHPNCVAQSVTIQKEVAERFAADPGSKAYGEVSVVAQALARVRRIAEAPPECFWPRPGVTSQMFHVERRAEPLTRDAHALAACARRLFAKRRKQIGGALGRDFPFPAGVTPQMRAEALTIAQFEQIARTLAEGVDGGGGDVPSEPG